MENLRNLFLASGLLAGGISYAQDSTGLAGTPAQEIQITASEPSSLLFNEWYTGAVKVKDGMVYDGVKFRYDTSRDQLEFKKGDAVYRTGEDVTGFTLPTGTALYNFRRGFPTIDGDSRQPFYQVIYDGNTKLVKRYSPQKNGTPVSEAGKLYVLKNEKLNPVSLKDRNSFLKLLTDERNKMNYVIRESQLAFDKDEDLAQLLEEYDAYKAGRGGN
ncbi:hypothetical protein DYBT9275_04204 [Dyadobacter sp. CECT 9275]|uniref:Uncharacterized protein n=1 Tax=Dyadobacter helix TaxID=2822344 RepID=A0A916JEU6_9BACT|nr:hypothetical protein [Dyadobacter sp. CECT 9275]CAG5008152.1 hypothetical protein DYBT9275_04204 [Dyadobacter sp. CECT 9275]